MLRDLDCKHAKGREKAYKLADSHGLYLYVTPKGHRSWRWNYRFRGKGATRTLGAYPDLSLADARIARTELDRLRRGGVDPAKASRQAKIAQADAEAATFERIAREWHSKNRIAWSEKHAGNIMKRLEREVFPHIGHLPITQVKPKMVLAALEQIQQRGPVNLAHRMRGFISLIFRFAIASDLAEHDPAALLDKALQPKKQDRPQPALRTIGEAQGLLRAAEALPAHPLTKLMSRMIALTAGRYGSLRYAEPHEFEGLDTNEPIWRIPASKMKLEKDQKQQEAFGFTVPLSKQAVEIVELAKRLAPGARYLFCSTRSYDKPMSENAINTMYRRLPGFASRHVPHGWRATFSTVMNERAQELEQAGDRAIIDLMLAHKPKGVEPLYNRASYMNRRRQIAQEWADLLLGPLPPAAALLGGPRR
jgi:hypothetical protein